MLESSRSLLTSLLPCKAGNSVVPTATETQQPRAAGICQVVQNALAMSCCSIYDVYGGGTMTHTEQRADSTSSHTHCST